MAEPIKISTQIMPFGQTGCLRIGVELPEEMQRAPIYVRPQTTAPVERIEIRF